MPDPNPFFRALNRISSVLSILVLAGVGLLVVFMLMPNQHWGRRSQVEVPVDRKAVDGEKVVLFLERVEPVSGSPVQMLKLRSKRKEPNLSSGGGRSDIRNVLFLGDGDRKARWLFETNRYVISSVRQLPDGSDRLEKREPAQAIYFEVLKVDSNGDGKIDEEDRITIAFSRPDGNGYTEVVPDAARVFSVNLVNSGKAVAVLLQLGRKVLYRSYSLRTFEQLSEQDVIDVPERL